MTIARFRRAAATVALAAVAAGLGVAQPAAAAPDQYAPSIGTATGTVTTGSVTVPNLVRTSAPCTDGTTIVSGFVNNAAAGFADVIAISANDADVAAMSTRGMPLDNNLLGVAQSAGKVLVNGRYELSVVCYPDAFGSPATGQFDAIFTITGGATPTSAGTTVTWDTPAVEPEATTTSLAVVPAGGSEQGTAVTLTATVSPTAAAGTVQFTDGGTALGAPVAVAAGRATLTSSALAVGTHQLGATFTPADTALYTGSSAATVPHTVTAPEPEAVETSTALAVSPAGTSVEGDPVTLTATLSPAAAAGTVQFSDGGTALGAPVAVTNGVATVSSSSLAVGAHSFSAAFTPADADAFTASTSGTIAYQVTERPTDPEAVETTTSLAASPAGTAVEGDEVTLTATVSPAAAVGTVQFSDGEAALGAPVAVTNGVATVSTSGLAVGAHSLTAAFTPADAEAFTASASAAVAYQVTAVPDPEAVETSTALAADPAGTSVEGDPVRLTATVSPAAAAGSVQFSDGGTALGAPVTVANGVATLTSSELAVGAHSFTAAFTPADPAAFTASVAAAVAYQVTERPTDPEPVETSTALAASPAGTAVEGAEVTVTATVSPAAAVGTVQFSDGGTALGAPVAVANGVATVRTSALAVGAHSLTAAFTPADATAFTASASAAVAYTVTAKPVDPDPELTPTSVKLSVTPLRLPWWCLGGWNRSGVVVLTAKVAPHRAKGVVTFSEIVDGQPRTVATARVFRGFAAGLTGGLEPGSHTFVASFTPDDDETYADSVSPEVPVKIDGRKPRWWW